MTALVIATVTVKNEEKLGQYLSGLGATLKPHGGKPVIRGKVAEALAGSATHDLVAVIAFPDMAALEAWYGSEAYRALIPIREEAADMTIVAHEAIG